MIETRKQGNAKGKKKRKDCGRASLAEQKGKGKKKGLRSSQGRGCQASIASSTWRPFFEVPSPFPNAFRRLPTRNQCALSVCHVFSFPAMTYHIISYRAVSIREDRKRGVKTYTYTHTHRHYERKEKGRKKSQFKDSLTMGGQKVEHGCLPLRNSLGIIQRRCSACLPTMPILPTLHCRPGCSPAPPSPSSNGIFRQPGRDVASERAGARERERVRE
jgi:hypothetical protein